MDGRVLLRCHAGEGCPVEAITAALGIAVVTDLFPQPPSTNGHRRIAATYDYVDEDGALLYQVVRFAPKQFRQRRPDGLGGWVWKLGKTRRVLYRLPAVLEAANAGATIYVVEGEKDVAALEAAGVVATCNPMGAGKWHAEYSKVLRSADVVIVQDGDDEGRKHAARVAEQLSGVAASVQIVEAGAGKDAADHLAAGLSVEDFVAVILPDEPDNPDKQPKTAPLSRKVVQVAVPDTPGQVAFERDILAQFRKDLRLAALAGEQRGAQLIYLMITSRVLPWGKPTNRPVSGIGKGTSSTGKSYTQQTVLRFFPPEAWIDLGSMSKRFLLYDDQSYAHKIIVLPEWSTIADDDEIVASLRTLLSEGRLVHGTVDGEGRKQARRIEKDGPTGLLMTTTYSSVDSEPETRCLSFLTDDTPEQTRRVYAALAALEYEDELPVDFDRWHKLQRWIAAAGEHRVVIPYVHALAQLMPDGATRLRRDFVSLLCLVRAHAILHQKTRNTDERGRIVATIADYAAVHALLDELVAEAVDASVSAATTQTVQAVRELLEREHVEHVSVKKIAEHLSVGRSATYDRVKRALAAGYLANVAKEAERGWKIALGGDLPAGGTFLPTPDEIVRSCPDSETGRRNGLVEPDPASRPGRPGRPTDTLVDVEIEGWGLA